MAVSGPIALLVIGKLGLVGGADLDQPRRARGHDVGDAERAADLDQLAARDDDFAAAAENRQRQQHRRGVVVDHQRVLGAGERRDDAGDVVVARTAAPASRSYSRLE